MQTQTRSRFRFMEPTTCALLSVLVPTLTYALQQRVEAVDYGLSPTDIDEAIRTFSPGAILITGTEINSVDPPTDYSVQYPRLKRYHDAGYTIFGYVSAHNGSLQPEGNPPMCRTEDCIKHYIEQWYLMYGLGRQDHMPVADGIMLDEADGHDCQLCGQPPGCSNQYCPDEGLVHNPERAPFFQRIYSYAHSLGFTLFINVAIPMREDQGYLVNTNTQVADIYQFYESPCTQFLTMYEYPHWPTWWWNVPSSMKAETISECTDSQWRDAVAKSKLYGTGYFFTFDGTAAAYNRLPPYWASEVSMILDSSTPRSVSELRQYFYSDTVFAYIWSKLEQSGSVVGDSSRGTLNLIPNANVASAIARVTSQSAWNLIGASVSVRMNQVVNNGTVNNKLAILPTQSDFNNTLSWVYEGGNLYAQYYVNGTRHQINGPNGVTYNPSNHAWLRIRESAGTVYWETSANGTSWVIQDGGSVATIALFPLTSIYVVLDAQTWAPMAAPGEAHYSHLNTGP